MTRKNYIGICLMVMYGIRLSVDILGGSSIAERVVGSFLTLVAAYATASLLEDKGD